MTNNELKIGDLVRLKSGGPLMTVGAVGGIVGIDGVRVCWFDTDTHKNGDTVSVRCKMNKTSFHRDMLRTVD